MASKKRTRGTSPHSGVVLLPPRGRHATWRARWTDPDAGKTIVARIEPLAYPTVEARKGFAVAKARELAKRKSEIELGTEPVQANDLTKAVEDYYKSASNELRPSTVELYSVATGEFVAWAASRGITSTRDLRASKLAGFRDHLLAKRKGSYVKGGKRGQRAKGTEKLSPQTVNWQLRAVKTMLNHLRVRGQVPLTSDAIADSLKTVSVPKEDPEFLRPNECVRLLEAVLRHDDATFSSTRSEHAEGLGGATLRYKPIAPLVAVTLLGGFRIGEVLALKWSAVDLGAVDADGAVVGEIRLKSSDTKTKHARTVSFDVSPSLRILLAALKLRAHGSPYVFGGTKPLAKSQIESARRRLIGVSPKKARKQGATRTRTVELVTDFGAPKSFTWQVLRSTCSTFLSNAPGIAGAASVFVSAKRSGHAVEVCERLYAGQLAVSRDARTLEQAMGIERLMRDVLERAGGVGVVATADVRGHVGTR